MSTPATQNPSERKDGKAKEDPADMHIPDNYVEDTLKNSKPLPPITWGNWWKELNYLSVAILTLSPSIAIYGGLSTKLRWQTAAFAIFYYFFTGLGVTAGYHRLWSHRSYNASQPLQVFLALAGAGAAQGSIRWWARGHRAHHRYIDTDLDPYDANRGFWWCHVGWMLVKPRRRPGVADVSDLGKSAIVRWQQRWYVPLIVLMGFALPAAIPGYFWGDWRGGWVYAGALRMCCVHHSIFALNSLAHWLGEAPFDDRHSPRDHLITAFVTFGEGYHNFHHQFPTDYRNAIRWYQYDPTKWFIAFCAKIGLASHLKVFPDNEVTKGQLTMELKRLRQTQDGLVWPKDDVDLPVISYQSFQEQSQTRALVLISGFIHDVGAFLDEHPGGRHLLAKQIGRDASTAFFGGVYDHSNAAHNLLSMMRVGVLHGGIPHALEERSIPPSQHLRVTRYNEVPPTTPGLAVGMENVSAAA
ncbi:delta9-fatty acid desaturase [Russula brevipes]|nr:delta9-fatty acid desaturase [Russula brevipes]